MATVGTADINPGDNSLQALLLREAQDEIAKLRGEIYSTRKVAEDRRQAQGALERQNKQLSGQVTDLSNKLRACEAEAKRVPLLEAELMELRQLREHVQRERQLHGEARKILESELRDERAARQQAEEAKARTDGERSRLQKARDELAAQLRVAQRKAIDAEEEQCRAEDEAAAARAELYALQQQQQQKQTGGPNGAEDDNDASHVASSASLQAAVEQLQAERARASSLSSALNATKAQLEQVHTQLRQAQEERAAAAAAAATASASATATAPIASSESSAVVVALREELAQVRAVAERAQSALQAECARVQQLEAALQKHGDGFAAAQQAHHPHHRDGSSGGSSSAAAAPQSVHATAAQPAAGSVAELVQQLAQLHSKVAALKLSRDRLLVVIDTHSVEIERLMTENKVLTEELTEARQLADKWEAQAQDSLTYVDKLKDLLEESAEWAASAGTDGPNAPSAAAGNGNSSTTVEQVHGALLREQAARAGLELQVRALCAELTRSYHANQDLGRSLIPVLHGVEAKLMQLHTTTRTWQTTSTAY